MLMRTCSTALLKSERPECIRYTLERTKLGVKKSRTKPKKAGVHFLECQTVTQGDNLVAVLWSKVDFYIRVSVVGQNEIQVKMP